MPSHTPGPWTAVKAGGRPGVSRFWAIRAEHRSIADCGFWPLQPEEANARLIAAAPDMLEALEGLLEVFFSKGAAQEERKRQGYDALKKARGRA